MPATPSIGKFFNFLILFLFIPPKAITGLENWRAINPNFIVPNGLELGCEDVLNIGERNIKSALEFIILLLSIIPCAEIDKICFLFIFLFW